MQFRLVRGETRRAIVNRTKEPPKQIGAFPVEKMSAATGGGNLFLTAKDDVGTLMAQVTEELPPISARVHTGGRRRTEAYGEGGSSETRASSHRARDA